VRESPHRMNGRHESEGTVGAAGRGQGGGTGGKRTFGGRLRAAVRGAFRQLIVMLPVLAGVVLLVGLFKTVISADLVSSVFSGWAPGDAFWGTVAGSILAGNPVNSYVMGKGFLDVGVSLSGVAAFILAWVSVGLVQLPAEVAALGLRFSAVRMAAAFVLSIAMGLATAQMMDLLS